MSHKSNTHAKTQQRREWHDDLYVLFIDSGLQSMQA